MISQLSWKIGGQQGEGLESTDRIFSTALNRLGYHLYGYRHFSSRIKGGHTNNKIRISTEAIRAISDDLDILVAFDQETIDLNCRELRAGGVVIADAKFEPVLPEGINASLFAVPFTAIAEELGTSLMKNMVATGASAAVLGLPVEVIAKVVQEEFGRKGQAVVDKNVEAVSKGAEFITSSGVSLEDFRLAPGDGENRLFMIGNDAFAFGALTAGCRFMPAYPITPASEIMEYLIKRLPKFGGTVIQTEDEIAAVTMAIGANYGGVRAMTASAGPGLSLMMEAIGLAGITETPVVIVDTQRGGPSTGLPTKQEQSDINAMIYGTHGEIPKIVLAPATIEDCFYDAIEAFNLAEQYQCPVIVVTDLQLSLGKQTAEMLDYNKIEILRGKIDSAPADREGDDKLFNRYAFTEDGVSPRVFPGTKNGIHHVTGVEHDQEGRPSENALNRKEMMDKRLRKLNNLKVRDAVRADAPHEEADLLIIGMGSTGGTIDEARGRLAKEGLKTNHATVRLLHPFPAADLKEQIDKAKQILVVENNATGQLADQIKLHVNGAGDKLRSLLKYDGNPFLPSDIYTECKGLN